MPNSEAVVRRCSIKKVFLEISQNSQENTCAGKHLCQRLFFIKKSLWRRCFPVNFTKFLRTPFLQNSSGGCFFKLQVNAKNSFTHTPSCILPSFSKNTLFSQNTSWSLLPKRLWKCESIISFQKYKRKVVILKKQSPGCALWKRCS